MAAPPIWTNLPEDLLLFTFDKLPIPDLLRSATVCTSWSSVVRKLRRRRAGAYYPWLMLLPTFEGTVGRFYSLSEKRFYRIHLKIPSLGDRRVFCVGASHGWLIFADRHSQLCLVNPITGNHIAVLPDVESLDGVNRNSATGELYLQTDIKTYHHHEEEFRFYIYRKAVLSSNPSDGNYTIMLTRTNGTVAFARAGDKKWTTVSLGEQLYCEDIIFHEGKFYLMSTRGSVHVLEPNDHHSPKVSILCNDEASLGYAGDFKYLVPCSSGDLLLVRKRHVVENVSRLFRVFKISIFKDGEMEEVSSFGNFSLFVGYHNDSLYLSCTEFPQLRPNCIYSPMPCLPSQQDIGIYSLEDESVKRLRDHESLLKLYETPVWFKPSLC